MKKLFFGILVSFSLLNSNDLNLDELKTECLASKPEPCNNLGLLYVEGRGVEQDDKKASEYLKIACDFGDAVGCYHLGFLYKEGAGVEKDLSISKSYFKKACDEGVKESCRQLQSDRECCGGL